MKFQVGDSVRQVRGGDRRTGIVTEAEQDPDSETGEWYLVDFGEDNGNIGTSGELFEKTDQ